MKITNDAIFTFSMIVLVMLMIGAGMLYDVYLKNKARNHFKNIPTKTKRNKKPTHAKR